MQLLLGIDFGTGACKVTAVDEIGQVHGEASEEYVTLHEQAGWSEQEPADWYSALCKALKRLPFDLHKIKAIALDGSTHNAVLLNNKMQPLRRTIMWTDQRSVQECEYLKKNHADKIFATAYQMPAPTWTLPQLMWLKRHEPEVLRQTRHILFVKDYVRYQLTGLACSDYIEAQGTLFYDMKRQTWSEELLEFTGLKPEVLPELRKPTDQAGYITGQAAAETGLKEGTIVICGSSDSAVEDYGAGAIRPGDCIVKLATAGNVNVMTAEAHPYPTTLTYSHIIDNMWYTVSATNAAALCMRWFKEVFAEKSYQEMDKLAKQSATGANGVFFHPYLQGERSPYWDANLRSSFTGLSISSSKSDFLRALLEGVAFSLLDCYAVLEEMSLPVERIFLIGGGSKSHLWSEIICDVFNLPLSVPSPGDASFGAALLAGVGSGVFANSQEAVERCLHIDRILMPDPDRAEKYKELFKVYREIHHALAPVYGR